MAGFVMMGLIAVLIIYISIAKKKKRAVVISAMLIGLFYQYVSYSCGPNSADVKVMQPMAEKISAYIVKNGIPESLKDIPDLPYGLEGCVREVEYSKFNKDELITEKADSKEKADFYNINEDCNFSYNNRVYYIELSEGISIPTKEGNGGTIDIGNRKSRTWASFGFSLNSIEKVIIENDFSFGSSKNTGICNPMRQ